jgi:hypothetical protein
VQRFLQHIVGRSEVVVPIWGRISWRIRVHRFDHVGFLSLVLVLLWRHRLGEHDLAVGLLRWPPCP